MKSIKLLYYALMIKYTSKTMDIVNKLLLVRVNYIKNNYLDNYLEKVSYRILFKFSV